MRSRSPVDTSYCFRRASAEASPSNFVRRPPWNSHRMRRMERPAQAWGHFEANHPLRARFLGQDRHAAGGDEGSLHAGGVILVMDEAVVVHGLAPCPGDGKVVPARA